MRKLLSSIAIVALLQLVTTVPAQARYHRAKASSAFCTATAFLPTPYTNPVTGAHESNIGVQLYCQGYAPMDVRLCPQLYFNGTWNFVRTADGYGTCMDSGWSTNILTGMTGTYNCTPYPVRSYIEAWYWHNSIEYHVIATSGAVTCS